MSRKRVYTIATGRSFLDVLARGLLKRTKHDPLALAQLTILLPTRRGRRGLEDALLRASDGAPLLLPRILAIGDVDDSELVLLGDGDVAAQAASLPPPIPPLKRLTLLSQLVKQIPEAPKAAAPVWRLARELAAFLDEAQTEGCDLKGLDDLVPDDLALHWQHSLNFLHLLVQDWPRLLATEGYMDAAERRRRLLETQADAWKRSPPQGAIIAAGSTGTIPATADLLAVVASLPKGEVILPGFDLSLSDDVWGALDLSHPQHALKNWLNRSNINRQEVQVWPDGEDAPVSARVAALHQVLLPATATNEWQQNDLPKDAFDGLQRLTAETEREEALCIALHLRQVLETKGRTGALVTPDRTLARRVAAELARWGIVIDDSAGVPLAQTSPALFARLCLQAAASDFRPLDVLALLKHPLSALSLPPADLRQQARLLEMALLRKPQQGYGLEKLQIAAADLKTIKLTGLLGALQSATQQLADGLQQTQVPLQQMITAHVRTLEALARSAEDTGGNRLWQDDAGRALASLFDDWLAVTDDSQIIAGADYGDLFEAVLEDAVVRPHWGRHPRLRILGPLEARLVQADSVVLGGLNEGTWPRPADTGPWLNRDMRRALGLPAPEKRIGLSAHDFLQAAAATDVLLTRARKVEGTPTQPSRFWLRLEALAGPAPDQHALRVWAAELDRATEQRQTRPQPTPPVADRPRKLSISDVERWRRDPYSLYAKRILRLEPLEMIDPPPDHLTRGNLIHQLLESFCDSGIDVMANDAEEKFLDLARHSMGRLLDNPDIATFWWPRMERIAGYFVAWQRQKQADGHKLLKHEVKGSLPIEGKDFAIHGRADRLDQLPDGTLEIIDYKTGGIPNAEQLTFGYAPQLPLEALMAQAGGFENIPETTVSELSYWQLTGTRSAERNRITRLSELADKKNNELAPLPDLLAETWQGLLDTIDAYDKEETAYFSRPNPRQGGYGDYDHLARQKEWSIPGGEDGSEGGDA